MSSDRPVRHWYGFFLSIVTALSWGSLPIAMQLLLLELDAWTISWSRLVFSALFVWYLLKRRGNLPRLGALTHRSLVLATIAMLSLMANFILYLMGLEYLNPETTGIIIQLAPFLLMAGSVLFYGERMTGIDILGALILFVGMLLFFNDRLDLLLQSASDYTLGVVIMLFAALTWTVYGLLQKTLLREMSSMQLTLLIYAGGTLFLLLFSSPLAILELDGLHLFLLLYGCLNMVIGYGAFTEAMQVWHAAKVSAVISLAPIITIILMPLAVWLWPDYYQDSGLNLLSYAGAAIVVAGSMLASLGKRRPK